jgi:hypothetical protein
MDTSDVPLDPDLKTLRLASQPVSIDALDRYIIYQETVLNRSAAVGPAKAHLEALEVSGLTLSQVNQLLPVCSDFCGRRWTVAELRRRRAGKSPDDQDRIDRELARLEDLTTFRQRYGNETIDSLLAREPKLVELHLASAVDLAGRKS